MEGVGEIINPGVVLSVAQSPIVEAPAMAVGPSMEVMQTGPQIPEVAEQLDSPSPDEAGSSAQSTQEILDLAKDKGYDAAFEKMAQGDFEAQPENEIVESETESASQIVEAEEVSPEELETRVQALEGRVSSLLQENMKLRQDVNAMKDLYAFTLEELLAFAALLRKKLEGEEDKGLLDVLITLIGKLFQAVLEPEIVTGGASKSKAT